MQMFPDNNYMETIPKAGREQNSPCHAYSCIAPHVFQCAALIKLTEHEGPNPVLLNCKNNPIIFVLNFLDTIDSHETNHQDYCY